MYILTDKETGGVYAVFNKHRAKTVQVFEDEDDAVRYCDLLMANNYEDNLEIIEVELSTIAVNCDKFGYNYAVITPEDIVIPPS